MFIFLFKTMFWLLGFICDWLLCIGIYHDRMNAFDKAFLSRQIDHTLYVIKAKNLFQFLSIVFITLLALLTYFITQFN
jgi:hypothetical protein